MLALLVTMSAAGLMPADARAAPLYSTSSPFNQPIAGAPTVDPRSSTMVKSLVSARSLKGFPYAVREWTIPAYVADASTPRYDVPVTGSAPGWRFSSTWRPAYSTMLNVPIPYNAKPDRMEDGHLSVLDPASGCEYDLFAAKQTTATTVLRPNADAVSGWRKPVTPTAFSEALDDPTMQPGADFAADYITPGGVVGNVTEVALDNATRSPQATSGKAWVFANTGSTTRLKIDVVWQGAVRASKIVPAASAYAWH